MDVEELEEMISEYRHYIYELEELLGSLKNEDLKGSIKDALAGRDDELKDLEQELEEIQSENARIERKEREREYDSFRL